MKLERIRIVYTSQAKASFADNKFENATVEYGLAEEYSVGEETPEEVKQFIQERYTTLSAEVAEKVVDKYNSIKASKSL